MTEHLEKLWKKWRGVRNNKMAEMGKTERVTLFAQRVAELVVKLERLRVEVRSSWEVRHWKRENKNVWSK
jgi:predicted acyl esterase